MSIDPIAMCELLVGLPDVTVLYVTDRGDRLRVTVEIRGPRPAEATTLAALRGVERD